MFINKIKNLIFFDFKNFIIINKKKTNGKKIKKIIIKFNLYIIKFNNIKYNKRKFLYNNLFFNYVLF